MDLFFFFINIAFNEAVLGSPYIQITDIRMITAQLCYIDIVPTTFVQPLFWNHIQNIIYNLLGFPSVLS